MKKSVSIILIVVIVVLMGVIGYVGWYEWDRVQKVAHNEACDIKMAMHTVSESADNTIPNSPCIYELVPPTLREVFFNTNTGIRPSMVLPCDQSATTTDCAELVKKAQERELEEPLIPISTATSYTEVFSTTQSGKIDEHLTIDNTFINVTFCDKVLKSRQIFIDGVEVVQRIAYLATNDLIEIGRFDGITFGQRICNNMPYNIYTKGILETFDVRIFTDSDAGFEERPGKTYFVSLWSQEFSINPSLNVISSINAYDGTLTDIATLKESIPEPVCADTQYELSGSNSEQDKNIYTNSVYGFSFTYPSNWHEGNNNGPDFFQLYNYDLSKADGGSIWPPCHNKIEASATLHNTYGSSSDYPEKSRTETIVIVAGRETKRIDITLQGGSKIRIYAIPLNNDINKFFSITIYGDPTNFFVLDEAMENLLFQ